MENKVYIAYAKMTMALYKFYTGDREEYKELFKSAISSLSTHGLPLFLAIAYNYRGICNFTEAENDWIKARKYAKEAKSIFAEARILPNLADIAMKKGKFDLASRYLDRSSEVFSDYSDYEPDYLPR